MADDTPVNFTEKAARKIVDAVKGWQREPDDGTGQRRRAIPAKEETCFGQLTNRVNDGWEWHEAYRKRTAEESGGMPATYVWDTVTNGRKGDDSLADEMKNLAIEPVDGCGV